jgi:hypothetical protein
MLVVWVVAVVDHQVVEADHQDNFKLTGFFKTCFSYLMI